MAMPSCVEYKQLCVFLWEPFVTLVTVKKPKNLKKRFKEFTFLTFRWFEAAFLRVLKLSGNPQEPIEIGFKNHVLEEDL